jgi:hypothetical protein
VRGGPPTWKAVGAGPCGGAGRRGTGPWGAAADLPRKGVGLVGEGNRRRSGWVWRRGGSQDAADANQGIQPECAASRGPRSALKMHFSPTAQDQLS